MVQSMLELGCKGTWKGIHDGGHGRIQLTLEEAQKRGYTVEVYAPGRQVFTSEVEFMAFNLFISEDFSERQCQECIKVFRFMDPDLFGDSNFHRLRTKYARKFRANTCLQLLECDLSQDKSAGALPAYLKNNLVYYHLDPMQIITALVSLPFLDGLAKWYFEPQYCETSGERILGNTMSSLACQRHQEEHPNDAIIMVSIGNDGGKHGNRGGVHLICLQLLNINENVRRLDPFNIVIGCVPLLTETMLQASDQSRKSEFRNLVTQLAMAVTQGLLLKACQERQWLMFPDRKVRPSQVILAAGPGDGMEHMNLCNVHNFACHLCETVNQDMGVLHDQSAPNVRPLPPARKWPELREQMRQLREAGTAAPQQTFARDHGIKTHLNPLLETGFDPQMHLMHPDLMHVVELGIFVKVFEGVYDHVNKLLTDRYGDGADASKHQQDAWLLLKKRMMLIPYMQMTPFMAEAFLEAWKRQQPNQGSKADFKMKLSTASENQQIMLCLPFVVQGLVQAPVPTAQSRGQRRGNQGSSGSQDQDQCAILAEICLQVVDWFWSLSQPFFTPAMLEQHYHTGITLFRTLGEQLPGSRSSGLWNCPKAHEAVHHMVTSMVHLGRGRNSGSEHIEALISKTQKTKVAGNGSLNKTLMTKSRERVMKMILSSAPPQPDPDPRDDCAQEGDYDDGDTPEFASESLKQALRTRTQRKTEFPFWQAAEHNVKPDSKFLVAMGRTMKRLLGENESTRKKKTHRKQLWLTWDDICSDSTFTQELPSLKELKKALAGFAYNTGRFPRDEWTEEDIAQQVIPLPDLSKNRGARAAQEASDHESKIFQLHGQLDFKCPKLTGTVQQWGNTDWTPPNGHIGVYPFSMAPLYTKPKDSVSKRAELVKSYMEEDNWSYPDLHLPCVEYLPPQATGTGSLLPAQVDLSKHADRLRVGRVHLLFKCRIKWPAREEDLSHEKPSQVYELAFLEHLPRYPADSRSPFRHRANDIFRVASPHQYKDNMEVVEINRIFTPAFLVPDFVQPFAAPDGSRSGSNSSIRAGQSRLWYVNRVHAMGFRSRIHADL
jgi:hypothetical protein